MGGLKSATVWIVIFVLFIMLFYHFGRETTRSEEVSFKKLTEMIQKAQVRDIHIKDQRIEALRVEGTRGQETRVYMPFQEAQVEYYTKALEDMKVEYENDPPSVIFQNLIFSFLLPVVLFIGLWIVIMRQIQSGGNKAMSFGKSRARLIDGSQPRITFDDVAGIEEAKEELREIVEFLKDPQKFSRLGGKIPKGVLLVGPPGTGKTLLAKAIAGEANVPFFSISGSDFVEMFVGVGASRVRDLFEQGKKHKPCLIFMDEIDAVGRQRFAGIGGGHDEREQTLNQLLVEMDGFNANEGVILIAATNRPDVLDPALRRPGRFDREITVDYPDVVGREKILQIYLRKVRMGKTVDAKVLARATPGFSGADLANIVNEAALLAARRNKDLIDMAELEEAKDRVMMGPERRSLVLTEDEKRMTSYHEAGHTLCAKYLEHADPVHKVSVIPRGRSLGATFSLPEKDRRTRSRLYLRDLLAWAMGGRAAEQVVFSDITDGASDDIRRATHIAHLMVCEFGMSEKLGPRVFGETQGQVFLGRELGHERDYSDSTASLIDEEVKSLIDDAYQRALAIITDHRDQLEAIAKALIERETLDSDEIDLVMQGKPLPDVFAKSVADSASGDGEAAKKGQPARPKRTPRDISLDNPKELLT
jgi:cell division protease FtsH